MPTTDKQKAIDAVKEAQRINAEMQALYRAGSAQWHQHETIDDKLHDALTALGD